jgi:hypothetical protein
MEQVIENHKRKFKVIKTIAWCLLILQSIQFYAIHDIAWFNIIECYRNGIWEGFTLYIAYYVYLIIFLAFNLPIIFKRISELDYKPTRNKLLIIGLMLFIPVLFMAILSFIR